MAGKVVAGDLYIHKTAIDMLPDDMVSRYRSHLNALLHSEHANFNFEIIAIKANEIQFIACSEWNDEFEPVVEDRIAVWFQITDVTPLGEWITKFRKGDSNNPLIFHHRNLFVKSDYTGFDYEEDCFRSEQIKQAIEHEMKQGTTKRDISVRMGRKDWWEKFCEKHGI